MDLRLFLAVYLPILVYSINHISNSPPKIGKIRTISPILAIIHAIIFVFVMAFSDSDFGDKMVYSNFYNNITYFIDDYKDIGWFAYVSIVKKTVQSNDPIYFYCITAFIYTASYCYYGYRTNSKEYWGYFIVLATGMFGFYSYGVTTIRNGFALGMVLIAMANKKWYFQLPFFLLAITFHKSCIFIVPVYFFTLYYKDIKVLSYIWAACFIFAAAGFSLLPYMNAIGGVDSRIESYAFSGNESYNRGFRLDFILYSMIPAAISIYWIIKYKIQDNKYRSILAMYISTNALWLLVIRMPYTNRIAYLSWFLIPILITYPFFKNLITTSRQRLFDNAVMLMLIIRILLASKE